MKCTNCIYILSYRKRFFEAGVERIVDQVIIPKLNTNFVPKIESIAFNALGIEKPSNNVKLKLEIDVDVNVFDLEQVSPESDKSQSNVSNDRKCEESDGRIDDLESPAFEPIMQDVSALDHEVKPIKQCFKTSKLKKVNEDDMDISDEEETFTQNDGIVNPNIDEIKSNLSSISSSTCSNNNSSSHSNERTENEIENYNSKFYVMDNLILASGNCNILPEITNDCTEKLPISETFVSLIEHSNQDSILSQVSSSSRLSIVTTTHTDEIIGKILLELHLNLDFVLSSAHLYNAGEEAQMQIFNENSSSYNSLIHVGKKENVESYFFLKDNIYSDGKTEKPKCEEYDESVPKALYVIIKMKMV